MPKSIKDATTGVPEGEPAMREFPDTTIMLMMAALVIGVVIGLIMPYLYNPGITAAMPRIMPDNTEHNDFTYAPHYVKFHVANYSGHGFAAFASDKLPVTCGNLDNESYITLPLLPTEKYFINIGDDCHYMIYPSENYYEIACPNMNVKP